MPDALHLNSNIYTDSLTNIQILRLETTTHPAPLLKTASHKTFIPAAPYYARLPELTAPFDAITAQTSVTQERGQINGLKVSQPCRFGHLLGGSTVMRAVYDQISRVAPTTASVLITGESGTGKELVAQTVHKLSGREGAPFIAVNCGAISPQLIESEMFGHEKGSFTGAIRQHKGHFERANGGTLFLDEISEMPAELQVKLLRVLETGLLMRVGSDHEIKIDVRIIAATNRSPLEAVASGKLREDLFYRLQTFLLQLPPLRARADDIEQLAQHFLSTLNECEEKNKKLSPRALDKLRSHLWPGNVRELKNVIHRAFIMSDALINVGDLPLDLDAPAIAVKGPHLTVTVGCSIADAERQLILASLQEYKGNKERAASILGISLKTLYTRLNTYAAKASKATSSHT